MPNYQFIERVHVYYTVVADSEEEAWDKLGEMDTPYEKSWDSNISFDVVQCEIENIWEDENA
jgi:hypothetical protein